jgi:hypothetical protein
MFGTFQIEIDAAIRRFRLVMLRIVNRIRMEPSKLGFSRPFGRLGGILREFCLVAMGHVIAILLDLTELGGPSHP